MAFGILEDRKMEHVPGTGMGEWHTERLLAHGYDQRLCMSKAIFLQNIETSH